MILFGQKRVASPLQLTGGTLSGAFFLFIYCFKMNVVSRWGAGPCPEGCRQPLGPSRALVPSSLGISVSLCRRVRPHKTRGSREQLGCFKPSGTALPSRGLLPIAAICARPRSACRAAGTPVLTDGRRCCCSVDGALPADPVLSFIR